jgi:WD40 repeat protein
MSDAGPSAPLAERVRTVSPDGAVVAVHFLGSTAAFVLAEEAVLLVDEASDRRVAPHGGGVLCAAATAREVVTGGDDGRVVATDAQGQTREVARDEKRRWVDQVAAAGDAVAWSAGKTVFVQAGGATRTLDLPSSAGGLAFAPKGFRVAVAHYDGATLWFPNASAKPETLAWHGSHLGVVFSPDGKFLVTTMQEPMLHGWRLVDARHMRMSGYSAKVRSLSWSANGKWLATSGSEQVILWPFQGKDGPMGKQPRLLAPLGARCVAVACHPAQEVVAAGYADGTLLLVRLADGAEVAVRRADGHAIAALAWSGSGDRLAFGTEEGDAGLVTL